MTLADRSRVLTQLWVVLPASLLHLLAQFVAFPSPLNFLPGCLCAGLMIAVMFNSRHDEFVRHQMDRAARVALATAGVLLLVLLPLYGPVLQIEASLAIAVIAVAFNMALGWFRLTEKLL